MSASALKELEKRVRARGSLRAVALELGVSKSHLSRILRGEREVTMRLARLFEEELGVPFNSWR